MQMTDPLRRKLNQGGLNESQGADGAEMLKLSATVTAVVIATLRAPLPIN